MSDRHHCPPTDHHSAPAIEFNVGASINLLADANCWTRPAVPAPCPAPRPEYNPCTPPTNYDRNSGYTTWNNNYDHTATGGGRGYNTGNGSWNYGTYTNPIANGGWNQGNYNWNTGADNGCLNRNQTSGTANWNNGYDNNYYTGSRVYSTGGVTIDSGNNFGNASNGFGWNARNDNGYKVGGISWNTPTGIGSLQWNGTDSNYTYSLQSQGIGGTLATSFGRQAPCYYPQRQGY